MTNNDYYGNPIGNYEHYKIKYQYVFGSLFPKEYTGGYFESDYEMGALFGSPLTVSNECDHHYTITFIEYQDIDWHPFFLTSSPTASTPIVYYPLITNYMDLYDYCDILKGGGTAPELAIPFEDENKITTFYDCITVRDTPKNTNYHIYNTIGQLVQTGATNPDISIAQLGKGIYILRLENGKAFKFVK